MITQSDFPALTDDLEEIFNESAEDAIADMQGLKIFSVKDTNRRSYEYQMIHGVEGIEEVTPGQDLPSINSNEGDSIIWTQRYFGGLFDVTKEMRKFDLFGKIEQLPKTLVDDAFSKIDQSFADVLLNGWSSSYTDVFGGTVTSVGPNAKTLFNSGHDYNVGSETYTNIITDGTNTNPAISRAAIIATRALRRGHKGADGIIRPVKLDTLIVSQDNEDIAERIVYSNLLQGSMDNDINNLKGKIKSIIVWERLDTSGQGTDTDAYWFMTESKKVGESLQAKFAERPTLDAPDQAYENKNWSYSCDFFYTVGIGHPAYIAGAKGDNS